MHEYDLEELKRIADTCSRALNLTGAQRDAMHKNAVFVCEDHGYFVVKVAGGYAAVIGADLLGCDEFEINGVYSFDSRDGAIACALAWSCSDAGGSDSAMTAPREMSTFVQAWS